MISTKLLSLSLTIAFAAGVNAADIQDDPSIAYKFSIGGEYKVSAGWEPLGPAGFYDTFGPELSLGQALKAGGLRTIAIAKFTHSGSQMNDWPPGGSEAKSRHPYPKFIAFVQEALDECRTRGQGVELAGIVYHLGENEMSMPPYRQAAPE